MAYIELGDLRGYIGIDAAGDDALLQEAIEAAQAYIESQTNRTFEAAVETRYYERSALSDDDSTLLDVLESDLLTVTALANGDGKGTSTYTPTFAAGTLTLATASVYSLLETGTPVTVFSTTNDPPAPLVQGTTYFAILTVSPVIKLATTRVLAIGGTAITLSDNGTGTHTVECGGTLISNTNYWLHPRNLGPPYHGIRLKRNTGVYWQWNTDCWVSVTGTWGYSATAPEDIKAACLHLAAFYYRQKDTQAFDVTAIPDAGVITIPQGIPATVTRILERYKRYL